MRNASAISHTALPPMHGNHAQSSNGTRISNRRRSSGPPPLRSAHRASIHREGSARPTRRAERPRRAAPLPPLSPCGSRARPGSGRGVQDPVRRPDVACINIRPGPAAADRGRGARGGASSRVTARRAGDSASAPTPATARDGVGLTPGARGRCGPRGGLADAAAGSVCTACAGRGVLGGCSVCRVGCEVCGRCACTSPAGMRHSGLCSHRLSCMECKEGMSERKMMTTEPCNSEAVSNNNCMCTPGSNLTRQIHP